MHRACGVEDKQRRTRYEWSTCSRGQIAPVQHQYEMRLLVGMRPNLVLGRVRGEKMKAETTRLAMRWPAAPEFRPAPNKIHRLGLPYDTQRIGG